MAFLLADKQVFRSLLNRLNYKRTKYFLGKSGTLLLLIAVTTYHHKRIRILSIRQYKFFCQFYNCFLKFRPRVGRLTCEHNVSTIFFYGVPRRGNDRTSFDSRFLIVNNLLRNDDDDHVDVDGSCNNNYR